MLLHVRNAVVHNSNIRGVETCSGWIFKSGSCKILSCARPQKYILSGPAPAEIYLIWSCSCRNISYLVPLPQKYILSGPAPAEIYLIWSRSRPRHSCFVPLQPAKGLIKVIYIDFFLYIEEIYIKLFCNLLSRLSFTTSQHKHSR